VLSRRRTVASGVLGAEPLGGGIVEATGDWRTDDWRQSRTPKRRGVAAATPLLVTTYKEPFEENY